MISATFNNNGETTTYELTVEQMSFIQRILYAPHPMAMKLWCEDDIQSVAEEELGRDLTGEEMADIENNYLNYDVFEQCYDFEWDEITNAVRVIADREEK